MVLFVLLLAPIVGRIGGADRWATQSPLLAQDTAGQAGKPQAAVPGRPDFRKVKQGERRVQGLLQRIVCTPKRVEFVMRLPDRVARFQAAAITNVEFISYRRDLAGNVGCGGRTPPDPVYLTSRTGPLDGTAVAVEFLPRP
jgi:hypothetical protein